MKQITSYGFNMDTACVELKFSDETAVAIDTIAVENEFAETWLDRRELNYLIYNDPLGYTDRDDNHDHIHPKDRHRSLVQYSLFLRCIPNCISISPLLDLYPCLRNRYPCLLCCVPNEPSHSNTADDFGSWLY